MQEQGDRRGGFFRREGAESRTPPVERSGGGQDRGREGSLPELKLTQAIKSPVPIIEVKPNIPITSEDGIIQPFHEYTIALTKNAEEIQVLDRQGRKIEGLSNTSTIIFN